MRCSHRSNDGGERYGWPRRDTIEHHQTASARPRRSASTTCLTAHWGLNFDVKKLYLEPNYTATVNNAFPSPAPRISTRGWSRAASPISSDADPPALFPAGGREKDGEWKPRSERSERGSCRGRHPIRPRVVWRHNSDFCTRRRSCCIDATTQSSGAESEDRSVSSRSVKRAFTMLPDLARSGRRSTAASIPTPLRPTHRTRNYDIVT